MIFNDFFASLKNCIMGKTDKIIVLVGIMGAGKTRVGRQLAKLLKIPFVDSDQEIEQAANLSVSEIFERYGEAEFRLRERQVIERLLAEPPVVLASGGGAFIQPEIRTAIKEKAISVWLKADIDVLVKNLSRSNNRPLLKGVNLRERLQQLMADRYPVYGQADITVVTGEQTPQNMARHIKSEITRHHDSI